MNLNNLMVQRKIKFLIFKTHTIECRTEKTLSITQPIYYEVEIHF